MHNIYHTCMLRLYCTHPPIYTKTYMHMHTWTHTHTHRYTHTHTEIYTITYRNKNKYIQSHKHIDTHTNTHTHIFPCTLIHHVHCLTMYRTNSWLWKNTSIYFLRHNVHRLLQFFSLYLRLWSTSHRFWSFILPSVSFPCTMETGEVHMAWLIFIN